MMYLQNAEFWCTVAVSRGGVQTLVSQLPAELENIDAVDGDFLDDNGFDGAPTRPGIYRARVQMRWRYDEPEFTVMEFERACDHIEQSTVSVLG